jgi:4'-phosphopantetheinyl transferase
MCRSTFQKGTITVGQVSLDGLDIHEKGIAAVLSREEHARAARFLRPNDRLRFVAARSAVRQILGDHLGLPAAHCGFEYSDRGKPYLSHPAGTGVQFNISHSGSLVLIAITKADAVGVDVEEVRTQFEYEGVIKSAFSGRERSELRAIAASDRLDAFFRMWTRKEAYLKCLGLGLQALDAVTIETHAEEQIPVVTSFTPAAGFAAAVALDGPCSSVCVVDLTFDVSNGTFVRSTSRRIR